MNPQKLKVACCPNKVVIKVNGTSEKFSRSSRAFSNMSKFYGLASNTSAQYRTVITSRQQRKAENVIAVRKRKRLQAERKQKRRLFV